MCMCGKSKNQEVLEGHEQIARPEGKRRDTRNWKTDLNFVLDAQLGLESVKTESFGR